MTGAALFSLLFAATALAAVGTLDQKPGTAGCVSETGSAGACVNGAALDGAHSVTVSPDGTSAYVASYAGDAVATFDRDPATGALTQKPGTAGCVSETGSGGTCADGTALGEAYSVAVSPDGGSVYVASAVSDAVATFDRDPATGALTQKPGTAGCVSETGSAGACADGTGLDGAYSVAVSPDGSSVYATSLSSDAVAIFDRNATTGALSQKPGAAGCVSETGSAGACVDGKALDGPRSVAVSPDGESAYVAAQVGDAVAVFDRNPETGALSQKPGTSGCVSETGSGGACVDGKGLDGAYSVTVSPDGSSAYAAALLSDAVAVFDRNPATGALTQKPGTAGCVSETGSGGACAEGIALNGPYSVTVSPDGISSYVASRFSDAVAIFDRNPETGALSQKPGTAGCVSETGSGGACADGTALDAPASVAISPDGGSAYVASPSSDAVAIFARDVPPETTINSGPDGVIADNTPTFTFSSSEPGSAYQCKTDSGPFGPCSGPGDSNTTFALADGPHRFQVRAIDPAANIDPTAASRTFAVDTVGPKTKIGKRPKHKVRTRRKKARVTVRFTSEKGARFRCRLDRGKSFRCSSPYRVKAASKRRRGKKHRIVIKAIDRAGNVGKPAKVGFRVIRKHRRR